MRETILDQIQPQCRSLAPTLKEAKTKAGKTNQQISDETGVPLSNIGKFFSDSLERPCIYSVAAVCICLDMSLDELFGIDEPNTDNSQELADALAKANQFEKELASANKENLAKQKLIETYEEQIADLKADRKDHSFTTAVLLCFLGFYILGDLSIPDVGVFRNGLVPAIIAIIAFCFLVVLLLVKEKKHG